MPRPQMRIFAPCQECFSSWEWCVIQPVFGSGVHPLYNTRKGKVYGPFLLTVLKLPALFLFWKRELNTFRKEAHHESAFHPFPRLPDLFPCLRFCLGNVSAAGEVSLPLAMLTASLRLADRSSKKSLFMGWAFFFSLKSLFYVYPECVGDLC